VGVDIDDHDCRARPVALVGRKLKAGTTRAQSGEEIIATGADANGRVRHVDKPSFYNHFQSMRIAQIVLDDASEYERKSRRIDGQTLRNTHEVVETTFDGAVAAGAALAHVYAGSRLTPPPARRFPIPFIASAAPAPARFSWPKKALPALIVSPLDNLPEAVEEIWFAAAGPAARGETKSVGVFRGARAGVANMVEQTAARIERFRDDVEWVCFDAPPSPVDLARLDAWCDPAVDDADFDGFVAEAIVAGKVVIASRTPINQKRLEQGRGGLLVPPRDPNELTHAILSALFKSEVAELKIEAARQTAGKFRPRQRLRVLEKLYQTMTA
jgi:hypothetical protein